MKLLKKLLWVLASGCLTHHGLAAPPQKTPHPNVIVVLTDDQGYGDMSCHGNPILQTPNLDQLSRDGVRFSQFFVGPLCQPTRASLMTGRNKVVGRRIEPNEQTLPQMFQRGGYATAIFGKWHLGEYRPFRPVDKGFDEQFLIGAGSIGQVEDYWGNDNFNTWFRDSKDEWQQTKGYCTDVLFDTAMTWIEERKGKPFFCFLSTNAAHSPYGAPEEFTKPYIDQGLTKEQAEFYGMIANVDHNLGRLRQRLKDLGIAENTLLIFVNDNGSAIAGSKAKPGKNGKNVPKGALYNANLRGKKGDIYEGGSRAAAFFVWPGTFEKNREVDQLAMHYDILPTLADLIGIALLQDPGLAPIEGISLKGLLLGEKPTYPKRYGVIYQGFWPPDQPLRQYENTSIRSQNYRLANGNELYDLRTDLSETKNIIAQQPDVAAELKNGYDQWWAANAPELPELRVDKAYPLGAKQGDRFTMNSLFYYDSTVHPDSMKWYDAKFYLQSGLRDLLTDEASPAPRMKPLMGGWKVDFQAAGEYEFVFRKGPREAPKSLTEIRKGKAYVALADGRVETSIEATTQEVALIVSVAKPGVQMVECWFDGQRGDGKPSGAYFVDIIRNK
jgi:arylsulfatase A-like enzyme